MAELARRQHGVVSRTQMLELGFTPGALDARIARRRLHALHRGVYAVGHPILTVPGRWMAAVLAGGPGAALSHRTGGSHWGLGTAGATIDVTAPRHRRSRRGLRTHQAVLPADELTVHDGIPVTTVARTLFDLASALDRDRLEQAIGKAEARGLGDSPSLPALMERYPRRRGIANLRAILGSPRLGLDIARSELELRFLEFLRRRDLPRPEINVRLDVGGRWREVDCVWRSAALVAELDSRRHHLDATAFESDRARDRGLVAAGWRCVRVTSRQLRDQPELVAADLRAALRR